MPTDRESALLNGHHLIFLQPIGFYHYKNIIGNASFCTTIVIPTDGT